MVVSLARHNRINSRTQVKMDKIERALFFAISNSFNPKKESLRREIPQSVIRTA
jgi:hypothetical protein